MDIGAGEGHAILDYLAPGRDLKRLSQRNRHEWRAQAIALSIEDRRTPFWHQTAAILGAKQIQYLYNRRVRDFSLKELGQFRVISDVIGGFSHTDDLSAMMERVIGFMAMQGNFFTLPQDVETEEGTSKPYWDGSPFTTEIKSAAGADVKVCSWLKSISCVQVTCELKTGWKPPIETYSVRKVCGNVKVPR
ncbi:MAG: hypothetical protein EXR39_02650, partial [Betaproteobacteria bacterium]|nr:hypothetical protein [Betaproteobacteria bacterium]